MYLIYLPVRSRAIYLRYKYYLSILNINVISNKKILDLIDE